MLFKINGERNSGTNFLNEILKINGFNVLSQIDENHYVKFWKHGKPDNRVKLLDERVIDIFIFRNLNEWLVSMFYNPYHIARPNDFKDFLTEKLQSDETLEHNFFTNEVINKSDIDKTIFEIRYYKIIKISKYKKLNPDVIFVNLAFLQTQENLTYFLQTLSSKYLNIERNNFITEMRHTKNSSNVKNRKYNIDINDYTDIIDKNKDIEIETFIDNLTLMIS